MFIESLVLRTKGRLWRYFLPRFTLKNHVDDQAYNYYGIYFSDIKQKKYQLVNLRGKNVVLEKWHAEQHAYIEKINLPLNDIKKMNVEIIHWRKQGPLRLDSTSLFVINYFTCIAYAKNTLERAKSDLFSSFAGNKTLNGLDRIMLLQMLVNEYVHQSPEKTHAGVTYDEVIGLLYGTLWYKHIKSENLRRKVFLLLQSPVITEGVRSSSEKYYIQGKAISTIVSWGSEDKREKQQIRIQKNTSRLILVVTASALMITLAILAQASLINLRNLWVHLTQLKPIKMLFKLM